MIPQFDHPYKFYPVICGFSNWEKHKIKIFIAQSIKAVKAKTTHIKQQAHLSLFTNIMGKRVDYGIFVYYFIILERKKKFNPLKSSKNLA